MERIAENLPEACAMPRFEDGAVNLQEFIRRLADGVTNGRSFFRADERVRLSTHAAMRHAVTGGVG